MVWPDDLAPFYPFPAEGWPAWQVVGALLLLLGITALAWKERKRRPYLAVGWLWYLGMLVPVLGLIQVGDQAWADRYTYLPLIGVFIALAWGVSDLLERLPFPRAAAGVLGSLAIVLCMVQTRTQIAYWQDDLHLWQHTLAVTTHNDCAHNNLGVALGPQKLKEAMKHFAEAVQINPRNDRAQVNLAKALLAQRKPQEAKDRLRMALEVNPHNDVAHLMLGRFYLRDQPEEARRHFEEALRLRPQNPAVHYSVGQLYRHEGKLEQAAEAFSETVRLEPKSAEGHHELGLVLARLGRWREAVASLRTAVDLRPTDVAYQYDLENALAQSKHENTKE
jgi:tetratricopeptide (TPR) repeat protein